ncbi:hypothetical protein MMC12_005604 [Toensbergia leucococca]|nr:hypothetical protein [Toensbergia leucococca]
MRPSFVLCASVLFHSLLLLSHTRAHENFTHVSDAVPQLLDLAPNPNSRMRLSLGGQNYTHCCLLAVNDSLAVENGTLVKTSPWIKDDIAIFRNGPFPCGATYNGSKAGAPPVIINYAWCNQHCSGWSISTTTNLNHWVGPLVGFLIPAVVFCLGIPRRRKLHLGEWFFNVPLDKLSSSPRAPLIACLAAILVTLDTLVWLCTVFTLAGPMLLSGIYEAYMDSRILSYLQEKIDNSRLSVDQRAHLLYAILVGNLDLSDVPVGDHSDNTAWNHVNSLTEGLRSTLINDNLIKKTKTRLRTMLASQYSFGTTVGAPVVFFGGSFIYTVISNLNNLGDNDTAHALAFGMWWMTIPHVSIVSGLLLAGNNPNTLEGIVGHESCEDQPSYLHIFALVYESRYKPAWMWFRGRSKKIWMDRSCQDNPTGVPNQAPDKNKAQLKLRLTMSVGDWMIVAAYAYILIIIPSTLGFLTAYYTPEVGLSCRSMTFLIYLLSQLWLIMLWTWELATSHVDDYGVLQSPAAGPIWWALACIGGLAAVFTAIGGTMMQIMGVFRNCLCALTISHWRSRSGTFNVSTNTADQIQRANTWWTGTGAGAIAFLGCICYVGWWYQRRLRFQFKLLVNRIDENPE